MVEEIPIGYRQTEIGIIPDDWNIQNILDKSTLKARIGWQGLTTAEYLKSGFFFLVTGTDFKNGEVDWDNCFFVEKRRYEQDKHIQLRKEDVLVTKDGTIGKIAYVTDLPRPATLNSGVFVIRPKQKIYLPLFLYYILTSHYFEKFLNKLQAGSTINHLYQKDFGSFNFVVPTYPEQEKIANVLNETDKLIKSLNKLIEKKKSIKQGAMQELLTGKKRLQGYNEGWDSGKIKNLATITTGAKNTQDKIEDGLYPFFVRSQTVERINTYSFDGEAVLTAGDGVGTGKVVHYINGKFDFHQRVYKISDFSERLNGYFFYLYFSSAFLRRIMSMTAKSSVDSVRMEMISDMLVPLPQKNEQIAIAQVLSDMDLEIEALESKRDKFKLLKVGLMQQLLTGRVRFKCLN